MIEIKPVKELNAVIEAPQSRSYTNRALIMAALAEGRSVLKNVLFSDDTEHMARALNQFGINVVKEESCFLAAGKGGRIDAPKKEVFLGNSGTAMRFLTGFASLNGKAILTGDRRMQERPIQDLLGGLTQLGVKCSSNNGFPPVVIEGNLKGGEARMNGEKSSQYFSSILMVAPYAKEDVTIKVTGKLTSKPYIDMTIYSMQQFGVNAENRGYREFHVAAGQRYKANRYLIEGDWTNASYFLAAAAITKGKAKIKGINLESKQGDVRFLSILEKMGCSIKKRKGWVEVEGSRLKGIDIDMNEMPDIVQTLAVIAAFADGRTIIRNVANLRIKETDRIGAVANELRKMGAGVKEIKDGLVIEPKELHAAEIETYDDHRMAMAFSIAGLAVPGIKIKNPECVSKTFPDFFIRLKRLQ